MGDLAIAQEGPRGRARTHERVCTGEPEELSSLVSFALFPLLMLRHHRLLLISEISPLHPTKEINYIHESLLPDPKNYHTWAYLHWLYSHFSALGRISEEEWAQEQCWCEEMLRTDGRNNSAWGWRWFLMVSRPSAPALKDGGAEEVR
jgi:protein farnesyltransferase/geranylgeranyltransferase type-1 subunit alpha